MLTFVEASQVLPQYLVHHCLEVSEKTLKSSSSRSICGLERGWSSTELSPGGDDRECSLRLGTCFLPRGEGVASEFNDSDDPLIELSPKDGIESLDMVLVDVTEALLASRTSSCSSSSGGLRSTSIRLFPRDMLNSFSETSVRSIIASTVNLGLVPRLRRLLLSL